MEDLMLSGGNTPFEQLAAKRLLAHKQLTVMCAVDELVKLIAECDAMMAMWREEVRHEGSIASEDTRLLAIEAMKDKNKAGAALDELMKHAEALGFTD